jgi:hypothetical protein
MIEISANLFVGSEQDEQHIRGDEGWFVIHACKEPYHRQALGYVGRAAPKSHPEYLIALRSGRLILNLVDADDVAYIPPVIIDTAITAINENIGSRKVLVHCNLGLSRSPTIAFLYLAKYTDRYRGLDYAAALALFRQIYPPYAPAHGIADFARLNWDKYRS